MREQTLDRLTAYVMKYFFCSPVKLGKEKDIAEETWSHGGRTPHKRHHSSLTRTKLCQVTKAMTMLMKLAATCSVSEDELLHHDCPRSTMLPGVMVKDLLARKWQFWKTKIPGGTSIMRGFYACIILVRQN